MDDSTARARAIDGYLSSAFAALPIAARGVLCTICILIGLFLTFGAVYGLRLLAKLGKQRGENESRAYTPGGLTGLVSGAVAICESGCITVQALMS